MREMRRVVALGLALTLVCLTAAPVAAAPRVEEPGWAPVLAFERLVDQLTDLLGDWMKSIFGSTNHTGDPNG